MASLQCYNRGCGQKYTENENKEDICQHHPGVPVFHDALKGWSCCNKRSTDFTEFLNIPGCSYGPHSNIKPPEPEKPQTNCEELPPKQEVIAKPIEPLKRPSESEKLSRLEVKVNPTLKDALEKEMQKMKITDQNDKTDTTEIKVGTSCKNNSCTKTYENEDSNKDICVYHSGVPIFHEGMKFWSCCQRKTTEFDNFLSQAGCVTGNHVWVKKDDEQGQRVQCRYDWHQTGSFVTISIYSKLAIPDKSYVEANRVSMKIKVVFNCGKNEFDKSIVLRGIIDPAKSSVKFLNSKVEINLKKMEPGSWSSLDYPTTTNNCNS